MLSLDARRAFLDFFAKRGHEEVAQRVAGAAQRPDAAVHQRRHEPVQGRLHRARPSRPSRAPPRSQKCVRAGGKHNDLENVGRTARHHTFFEMLGNFSFGDYFKADAIAFARELLTKTYAIDPDAARLHRARLRRRGARALEEGRRRRRRPHHRRSATRTTSGRWARPAPAARAARSTTSRATTSPAPTRRPGGKCQGPACDCDRWVEIWNLVFMQFEQVAPGDRRPLPKPSVDTGMGLERLCAVLQGVRSNYETDLLRPLIDRAADAVEARRSAPPTTRGTSVSLRVIADHARAAAFLIADGVLPRQDRARVRAAPDHAARRLSRLAAGHQRAVPARAGGRRRSTKMGGVYPELRERASLIAKVAARGGDALPRDARARRAAARRGGLRRRRRRKAVPGATGLHALRHLRLPARPDPGHRRAARLDRRRGRLRGGDGRAAPAQRVRGLGRGRGRRRCSSRSPTASGATHVPRLRARPRRRRRSWRWSPTARRSTSSGPYAKDVGGGRRRDAVLRRAGRPDRRRGHDRVGARRSCAVRDCKRPVSTLWVHLGEVDRAASCASATPSS